MPNNGKKVRVSFADDIVSSNQTNRIQISSDSAAIIANQTKTQKHETSGSFKDMLMKRYNISSDQFVDNSINKAVNEPQIAIGKDEGFTLDTFGEHPDDPEKGELQKETEYEIMRIKDIPPLDQLLNDLISKTQSEKESVETSIKDIENYLNSSNEKLEKLDENIRIAKEKTTFLLYIDYTFSDLVSLMDTMNDEVNNLKILKKNVYNQLSHNTGNDTVANFCTDFTNKVMELKSKIADRYSTPMACDILAEFHNRYPNEYSRSGIDSHVITFLLFYAQLEILLWDPLFLFSTMNGNSSEYSNGIFDIDNDITHFVWYKVASKFNTSETFIKIIVQKVYMDAVFDLFKLWEWRNFAKTERIVEILRPLTDLQQFIDFIGARVSKLTKIKSPEALEALNTIRSFMQSVGI